ncbi:hypothetical protein E4U16_005092 [Claviceps sp. LM84 group G4]|nr:hypothetical protein E4U33_006692 [Claviceps sp. LM78 group G4]KAG6072817.1 hypothetical protein E4U16_005092 [Claviceps sp. LM84 group G4]
MLQDPLHVPGQSLPTEFDAFRYSALREESDTTSKYHFSMTDSSNMAFGYGKKPQLKLAVELSTEGRYVARISTAQQTEFTEASSYVVHSMAEFTYLINAKIIT